ncbi:PQQ-binding-like beta-propeller repeat protein [Gordonia hongkongensis]|uniref:outer membrane protein assembly factor BamB family protein n=1 Tax=Gordonia hongkongensis TaxID=1701090 RepID=UPI003EBAFF59
MHGIVVHHTGEPAGGAVVSCGEVVTVTGSDGRFDIPRPARSGVIVLSRPSGHTADPWWHPVPDDDDVELLFVLRPQSQSLPYRFVHMTDTHLTTRRVLAGRVPGLYEEGSLPEEFGEFLSRIPGRVPDAQSVMITGDLVDHGLDEEFDALIGTLAGSPLPTYSIPGNHDHMDGVHRRVITRTGYLTNAGDPGRYERRVGPRYYSFTVANLHVVALDWHSYELGIDDDIQNAWLRADLSAIERGAPYIVLAHDQPDSAILDELPWPPVATFSGHWHTSRVVEVDGTLHVNSPPSLFAGLDHSPPAYRVVTWDGRGGVTLSTRAVLGDDRPPMLPDARASTFAPSAVRSYDPAIRWQARSSGAGHRQPAAIHQDLVVIGGQIEDAPSGRIEAFDLVEGELRWRADTRAAVKCTPAVTRNLVVVTDVSGDLTAVDRGTGECRWQVPSPDPYRRFVWGTPVVAGDLVYYGTPSDLRAVDLATGELVWQRTDLAPHHNLLNHAAPLVVGDLLVIGFWPTPDHPMALDARTGGDVWTRTSAAPSSVQSVSTRLLVLGTATYDHVRDLVVLPAHSHTIAVDRADGTLRWRASHPGGFNPATPLVTERGYAIAISGHGIRMLDPDTGDTIWDTPIRGAAPFPMASYSKTPHPTFAPPVMGGTDLLVPGLDGTIRRIDLGGQVVGVTSLRSPIAAPLTVRAGHAVAVATDGSVLGLAVDELARRHPAGSERRVPQPR